MHTRSLALVFLLFTLGCNRAAAQASLANAEEAADRQQFAEAATLFERATREEKDPAKRIEAAVKLANIEWRVFGKLDQAAARLRGNESHEARIEAARIAVERRDYAGAREETRKALAAAKTPRERQNAEVLLAKVVDRDARASAEELRATIASMRGVIADAGPLLVPSRLLARTALRAGDAAAALEGINAYYRVSPFAGAPRTIAAAHADVTRILTSWRGTPEERAALARALGGIRFVDEVLLVTNEGEVAAYARALRRVDQATIAYYRAIANGKEDDDVLRDAVERELPAQPELAKRYGTVVLIGRTNDHVDLHLGHIVDERDMRVEQYGHKATLRFVALDSMVSNGYSEWAHDGRSGDGGWGTAKEIVQVRPRYADGALREWRLVNDPIVRAEDERKIAEETARDLERAREKEIRLFPGLALRLRRQYLDSVAADLRAKGLEATALRDAFLARVTAEHFASSIELHEGRHAIDAAERRKGKVWELEYRAKLAEIALAPAPREALGSVLDFEIGGDSTHGKANEKLAQGLVAWMRANRPSIAGLDPARALLPQIDRLSDEQIRTAVRSLDLLAR
jgi:hypothetical protein